MRYSRLFPTLGVAFSLLSFACNRGAPGTAGSTTTGAIKEETPGLAADAKVDPAKAREAALAKVPNGKIVKEELEKENGKLVYSFDIKDGTHPGIEEVMVDAVDGSVVSVEHEDAAKEADEARKEAAEAKPGAPSPKK
jgi:hypothetical protein